TSADARKEQVVLLALRAPHVGNVQSETVRCQGLPCAPDEAVRVARQDCHRGLAHGAGGGGEPRGALPLRTASCSHRATSDGAPPVAYCPKTHSGRSRGNAINPMMAVEATSMGLLTVQPHR